MANKFDVKTKTFFQIAPRTDRATRHVSESNRIVFMSQAFSLSDIILITEPVMVRDLHYTFTTKIGHSSDLTLEFEFKRKQDCLMAQRELSRAWTRTGEFSYEDVPATEGTSPE